VALKSALNDKDTECRKHKKEAHALKRLLADAKTRQENAVADATAAADARVAALEGRNERLMASLQAATSTTRTAAAAVATDQLAQRQQTKSKSSPPSSSAAAASRARRNSSAGIPERGPKGNSPGSVARSAAAAVGFANNSNSNRQPKAKHGRQPLALERSLSPEVEEARLAAK
jgi:hypothetical protein